MSNGNQQLFSETLKKRHPHVTRVPIGKDSGEVLNEREFLLRAENSSGKAKGGSSWEHEHLPRNKILAEFFKYRDWILPSILTILSLWTRLYKITKSNIVVWDEAHFGKFASHYLKRDFYFDVHPPLGKMLVGLGGLIAGYNGRFEFKSGETYPEDFHYGVMRTFLALFGVLMVPLAYGTARELSFSRRAAFLAAWMVLFDTALTTISRFILLDSMLLCFTCLTFYCHARYNNFRHRPFTTEWWTWLALTGVSIGLVTSVKWVGFFVTALVGLSTAEDLWHLLGDLKLPKVVYLKHWIARIVCLIGVPVTIYIFSFYFHFLILNMSGPGDAQMSSLFQASLEGNKFHENPILVAFGSKITLKNNGYGGGLLHSHVQTFPGGSQQQQVTCYHHKDDNNHWKIFPKRGVAANPDEIRYVKNGDVIRLVHESTGRNLHSHPVAAPMTKNQWEVSCYGNDTIGDMNDEWMVEIVDDLYEKNVQRVKSLTTRLRFRHVLQKCLLRSHNVVLPQWGFKQSEVICEKGNHTRSEHNIWNVEQHWNEKLPSGDRTAYKSNFLKDFWHLNVAMMTSNNALVPDPDKEDNLTSSPAQWPFAAVGLRMCSWADNVIKFYLLGNPAVWWPSTAGLLLFLISLGLYVLRIQRKYHEWENDEWSHFLNVGKLIFGGWLLHYMPFCIMGRVTYLHHYFPALYFSIFMVPFLLDHFFKRLHVSTAVQNIGFAVAATIVLSSFCFFSPIVFGIGEPISTFKGRKWLNSWNVVD